MNGRSWTRWVALALLVGGVYWVGKSLSEPLVKGRPAPDFQKVIAAGEGIGEEIRLSDFSGEVVVLDFWASWCTACEHSVPMVNRVYEEFAQKGVRFFGVNAESLGPRKLEEEYRRFGMVFPSLQDEDRALSVLYSVHMIPMILVIGRDGVVQFASSGEPRQSRFAAAIQKALDQKVTQN